MATIRALAGERVELTDYVRQTSAPGACAPVRVGRSPARRIGRDIEMILPGYAERDSGRTLDEFTGLCSIVVRATRGAAALTVMVSTPAAQSPAADPYTKIETGIESESGATTKYVRATTTAGWTVLIGATGRSADLPGVAELVRLAQEPGLTW
jgi:hypothetical protein